MRVNIVRLFGYIYLSLYLDVLLENVTLGVNLLWKSWLLRSWREHVSPRRIGLDVGDGRYMACGIGCVELKICGSTGGAYRREKSSTTL